jgi:branched-chain amino acid aminotransferase
MTSALHITKTERSRLTDALREEAGFGAVFSDHMLVADWSDGEWRDARIVPYGPLPLPPAPTAVHYGQAFFEGFKAHRLQDDSIALFRPGANHARFNRTATRLAMPNIPDWLFVDGIRQLVSLDRDWVPYREGGSLYVRPVAFATDEILMVRASSTYRFVVITSPVGPYFAGALKLVAEEHYVRAFLGGMGDVKAAGNYAGSLLAAREAQARGYQNVVWLDPIEHRFIEESGVSNIMFVVDGRVVTPPLSGTILPGVTRDSVLTLCRDVGIGVDERPIRIDEIFDLRSAGRLTEAAAVGTAATVTPIGHLRYRDREMDLTADVSGGVLERIGRKLHAIRTGREPDAHEWLVRA